MSIVLVCVHARARVSSMKTALNIPGMLYIFFKLLLSKGKELLKFASTRRYLKKYFVLSVHS